MSLLPHYDKIADRACRRHDHGARYEVVGIFVKLGCDADHDLAKAGKHNNAVSAVFGDWGLAGAWGCFDKGDYYCWRWKKRGFIVIPRTASIAKENRLDMVPGVSRATSIGMDTPRRKKKVRRRHFLS